jgi:hypothetical protein
MTGWRVLTAGERKAIGIAVYNARAASCPRSWKELTREFGRSKTALQRYEHEAVGAGVAGFGLFEFHNSISGKMRQ